MEQKTAVEAAVEVMAVYQKQAPHVQDFNVVLVGMMDVAVHTSVADHIVNIPEV